MNKEAADMKKILAIMVVMLAAVMCFAACSESSSRSDSSKQTKATDAKVVSDGKLLTLNYQPGGDMTKEQFEAGKANYTVYGDGRVVNDKNGEENKLEGEDIEKVKEYAKMVKDGTADVIERGGDDMPSYSVTVFEADGREHQLTAYSGSEIVGFSEIYKLVREKFEQK